MKYFHQAKPDSNLWSYTAGIDREPTESQKSMLKILAQGNLEVERGQFRSAADVFAELDQDSEV